MHTVVSRYCRHIEIGIKEDVRVCCEFIWLSIRTDGGLFANTSISLLVPYTAGTSVIFWATVISSKSLFHGLSSSCSEIVKVYCKNRQAARCIILCENCIGRITVAQPCSGGCLQSPLINMTYAVRSTNRGRDRLKLWWSSGWWRILRDVGHLPTFPFDVSCIVLSWWSCCEIKTNSYGTNADLIT
jgi:hypothetical protein